MSRSRKQTEMFSQLVNGKHFYRQRTRHEQALADCFDNDDNFFQAKANVVWYNISKADRQSRMLLLKKKYMGQNTKSILYKIFKLHNTKKKLMIKNNELGRPCESEWYITSSKMRSLQKISKVVKGVLMCKLRDKYSNTNEHDLARKIKKIKNRISTTKCHQQQSTRTLRIKAYCRDERLTAMKIIKSEIKTANENPDMVCPISCFLMNNPVTTCNGFTYDRTRYTFRDFYCDPQCAH